MRRALEILTHQTHFHIRVVLWCDRVTVVENHFERDFNCVSTTRLQHMKMLILAAMFFKWDIRIFRRQVNYTVRIQSAQGPMYQISLQSAVHGKSSEYKI